MGRTLSIIRDEEYSRLRGIDLDGAILDLGGSRKSGYHELIGGQHTFTTVNIDARYGCDLTFDIQEQFPLADASFDHVVSLNVLEHLSEPWVMVEEAARVVKPGGLFVGSAPFLFQVHGSPSDYYRYTEAALLHGFGKHGFEPVRIEPLGAGLLSLFFQTIGGVLPGPVNRIAGRLAVEIDRLLRSVPRYRRLAERIPLGYFFVFRKA